jgi:hypothetical protein
VRPLAVVAFDERVEAGLLLEDIGDRGLGGFLLQREMHALVPAVLLGVPWLDALDRDAQAQPPDRELAQTIEHIS